MGNDSAVLSSVLSLDIERYTRSVRDRLHGPIDPRIQYALDSLQQSITKKFVPRQRTAQLQERAVSTFLSMNERCSWFRVDSMNFDLLNRMRHTIHRMCHPLSWQSLLRLSRHGPGASVGSRQQNSAFEKLFVNTLTATSGALYSEYHAYICTFPSWRAAELRRSHSQAGKRFDVVKGSTLSTVPKNSSTDRTICTEPSLNMFFQLGLGERINAILRRNFGYDPALQPDRNRMLAKRGSLKGDVATIDLKSASDLISLELVRYLFPSDWVAAFEDCRSEFCKVNGNWVRLNMISSMGNGFTFPLQTFIFSVLISSLCDALNVPFDSFESSERFGVFGDDIIVPVSLFDATISALSSIGFIPNEEKSFGSGFFRESCGTDWYLGRDVRGVYATDLSTDQAVFSLINRLNRWSAKHRVPLPDTIQYLLPKGWRRFYIPLDLSDTSGIKVPMSYTNGKPFYRCYETVVSFSRVLSRVGILRRSHMNPLGFMIASTISSMPDGRVSRRMQTPRFAIRRGYTPCWDHIPSLSVHGVHIVDWEAYCFINLTS